MNFSSHAKGTVDAIGGVVKRVVWSVVFGDEACRSAVDFVHIAKKKKTKRRGKILNFNDHQYTKKRSNKSTDEWRCRIRSCNSIIVLARDASTVIHPPTDHSHIPDPIQAKVDEFKNTCKKRAREETIPISQIHKQELVKCSLKHNDISFLPSYSSIDSSFYRKRLKGYPKLPK
ncbi:unnamed protein product, partial [Didymodactylos carnosus]